MDATGQCLARMTTCSAYTHRLTSPCYYCRSMSHIPQLPRNTPRSYPFTSTCVWGNDVGLQGQVSIKVSRDRSEGGEPMQCLPSLWRPVTTCATRSRATYCYVGASTHAECLSLGHLQQHNGPRHWVVRLHVQWPPLLRHRLVRPRVQRAAEQPGDVRVVHTDHYERRDEYNALHRHRRARCHARCVQRVPRDDGFLLGIQPCGGVSASPHTLSERPSSLWIHARKPARTQRQQ